jgi:hypothetical protein
VAGPDIHLTYDDVVQLGAGLLVVHDLLDKQSGSKSGDALGHQLLVEAMDRYQRRWGVRRVSLIEDLGRLRGLVLEVAAELEAADHLLAVGGGSG